MKKTSASQPGFFTPRVLVSFVLLSVGLLLGIGAFPTGQALAQPGKAANGVPSVIFPGQPSNEPETKLQSPSARYHLSFDIGKVMRTLPALDQTSIETRAPDQVGVNRPLELSSQSIGKRLTTSDGTHLIVLAIKSPGAKRLRVHFENFRLPAGDEVYLHAPSENSKVAGPYRDKGPWGDRDFWSSSIQGDTVIIEYHLRAKEGEFRIPEICHIYSDAQRRQTAASAPDVLECELDASCYSDIRKNAVARIEFIRGGAARVCTGTLLNDRAVDFTPYFLTANHCVATQAIAQTVETYWFYQTTSCNSGMLQNDVHQTQGADLLVTEAAKDFALLRLIDTPPGGVTFAGWEPAIIPVNTTVYGLHHPGPYTPPDMDSYLRRAEGPISNANIPCDATGLLNGYQINWTMGLIEPGSSGSGLWTTEGLIGVLSCVNADFSCTSRSALYSKFSDSYPLMQPFIDPQITPPGTTLGNISTRLRVETGDNVLIGGFIVTGTQAKRIILRAIGPSLTFPGRLSDPVLELRNSSGDLIASNDDWRFRPDGSSQQAEIVATGIPPADGLESALVVTLPANNSAYTAIVRGYQDATGIGVVEAFDLNRTVDSRLSNISTRGFVSTGDNVMIAGTIITGTNPANVLLRAIGPSLANVGVPSVLPDPTIELRDSSGTLIASNDDWRFRPDGSSQEAEIVATGIAPSNTLESALLTTLPANNSAYTAIVRGYQNLTGVAVVEAYQLQ